MPSSNPSGSHPETEPGVLAATKWIACGLAGPNLQAVDLIAAVNSGLVRLNDPWGVTRRGRFSSRGTGAGSEVDLRSGGSRRPTH